MTQTTSVILRHETKVRAIRDKLSELERAEALRNAIGSKHGFHLAAYVEADLLVKKLRDEVDSMRRVG